MQQRESPTLWYCLGCFAVVALMQVAFSAPVFDHAIFVHTGLDPLRRLGNDAGIGQGKVDIAVVAAAAAAILLLVPLLASLRRPGWRYRCAAFAVALLALGSIPLWYKKARDDRFWQAFRRIELVNLPTADPRIDAIFDRRQIPASARTSFAAFAAYAEERYDGLAPALALNWDMGAEDVRKATFFAGLVGTLFAYGNKNPPDQVGCASDNELRAAPAASCLPAATFLNSRIGCCEDYAHLMKYLLDDALIPNRLVLIPGHIFNEISVAGRRYVVDANTGLVVDRSWRDISAEGGAFHVYLLPLAGLMDVASENYRPLLGRFRGAMIRLMAQGGAAWEYRQHNDACFPTPARQATTNTAAFRLPEE